MSEKWKVFAILAVATWGPSSGGGGKDRSQGKMAGKQPGAPTTAAAQGGGTRS